MQIRDFRFRALTLLAGPRSEAGFAIALIQVATAISMMGLLVRLMVGVLLGAPIPFNLVWCAIAAIAPTIFCLAKLERAALIATGWLLFKLGSTGISACMFGAFMVGRSIPMADGLLASIDESMGFHWIAYMTFFENHPWLNLVLQPAYMSIFWQPVIICIVLPLFGLGRQSLTLVVTMGIGIMIACGVAMFVPAYGAYHYYGVVAAMHPHLTNLTTADGTTRLIDWLRLPVPIGAMPQEHGGLVAFPSFHTTCALSYMWAVRKLRPMLWLAIPLNILMLVATPLHGSHYISDMVAGAILALLLNPAMDAAFNAGLKGTAVTWFVRRPNVVAIKA